MGLECDESWDGWRVEACLAHSSNVDVVVDEVVLELLEPIPCSQGVGIPVEELEARLVV